MTPKIKTGCNANWTKGLVPMKWESMLKISGLKTEVMFIKKCWSKNIIKKIAEIAIANFFPIDVNKKFFILYNCNTKIRTIRFLDKKLIL